MNTLWVLIMLFNPGWQVSGTGTAGTSMTSVTFQSRGACVDAMNTVVKSSHAMTAWCFPSNKD